MKETAVTWTRHIPALFRQYGKRRCFRKKQQLFQKDDSAETIYFLESGKIRAYLLYPDGTERTLCFIERGNLIGEEAVSIPPVRIVCAEATTDLVLYSMTGQQLIAGCTQDDGVLPEVLALFMKKIDLLHRWIFYAQFRQNSAKLACFLYTNTAERTDVHYTQEQIASVTGMSRVSVSHCLRDFADEGLLLQGYRCIHVLNRQALQKRFESSSSAKTF